MQPSTMFSYMETEELLTRVFNSVLPTPLEMELARRLEEAVNLITEILDALDEEDTALALALLPAEGSA